MDISRQHDLKELKEDLKTATDPLTIKDIKEAGANIEREQHDGYIREARQVMIKERLQGRIQNVKDVQDNMINRRITTNFGFNISDEQWQQIYDQS